MDDFKEFQGSDLDNAIKLACSYYNATREKLEIDIIQDSKTGIFGIVGARKAKIKARKVVIRGKVDTALGDEKSAEGRAPKENGAKKNDATSNDKIASTKANVGTKAKPKLAVSPKTSSAKTTNDDANSSQSSVNDDDEMASYGPGNELPKNNVAPNSHRRSNNPAHKDKRAASTKYSASPKPSRPVADKTAADKIAADKTVQSDATENSEYTENEGTLNEGLPLLPFEDLDQEVLKGLCFEAVRTLTSPIVGEVPIYVEIQEGRVNIVLDCGDDSGLLIGREGQTLASIQYLASRVVSRKMQSIIRVQLDAGDYRLRQDEKLQSIALALAERVKSTGRSYSTRPLSSYHRRIVHLTLQESLEVQTRSSGDGALKRVIIQRKRG